MPYTPLRYALQDFLKSAGEGTPVVTSAADGMRSTVVGILADKAVREQTTVVIDPDLLRA